MVMAKQSLTGNCFLVNLKEFSSSEGWLGTLGIKTVSPACCPVISLTSKTLLLYLVKIPLLPLQTPCDWCKFFRIITGHPAFSSSFASGRVEELISFRCSTG